MEIVIEKLHDEVKDGLPPGDYCAWCAYQTDDGFMDGHGKRLTNGEVVPYDVVLFSPHPENNAEGYYLSASAPSWPAWTNTR